MSFDLHTLKGVADKAMESKKLGRRPRVVGAIGTACIGTALGAPGVAVSTAIGSALSGTVLAGCAAAAPVLALGAVGAGLFDIAHRVAGCRNVFFKPMNHPLSEVRDKLVTVIASPIVSLYFALEQSVVFFAYMIKSLAFLLCLNKEKSTLAFEEATCYAQEACLHLAGILAFPIINLVDLGGSLVMTCVKSFKNKEDPDFDARLVHSS